MAAGRATVGRRSRPSPNRRMLPVDDSHAVTVSEAARILGKTPDAVRGLVRRGTLVSRRGNDGRPRVMLSAGQAAGETIATVVATSRDGRVEDLRERLEKAEGVADRLRQELRDADRRAARAEGQVVELHNALNDLAVRLDKATAELTEARRSWFERLLAAVRR